MKFSKIVKKKHLWRQVAKILNGLLELSPREMEIFSILLKIDSEWEPILETDVKDIVNGPFRKSIMKETLINKNNLSKYLTELKNKGLVIKTPEGGHIIKSLLRPVIKDNTIEIRFVIEIENGRNK